MNKRIKTALIIIEIILVAALAISLAYSRYFSKVTGEASTTVAKWSFKVNGQADTIATINLGATRDANNKVADGKVAPGTSGKINLEIDATGTEVALDYEVKFENVRGGTFPENLKFYQTKTGDVYSDEITDITKLGLTGTIGLNDSKTKTVTIYWKWDYQTGADDTSKTANDVKDTTSGKTAATITFDIVVTGTQQLGVPQKSYYGKVVSNYTAGGIKWRVFHKDENNIYLISDYYVPNTSLPTTSTDSSILGVSPNMSITHPTYGAYFTNILNSYTGSEWIRGNATANTIANKWLRWVNSYPTSTNNNIKAVSYMLDTKAWSKFVDSAYAEYAIGGPTIEMYCASYKATHSDKYIDYEYTSSSNGYNVKWSTDSSYTTYLSGLDNTGEYNGIYITESSDTNAWGYWLASPIANNANHLMRARCSGTVYYNTYYGDPYYGFRPIVCLKSGVQLVSNGDGTYRLQDKT